MSSFSIPSLKLFPIYTGGPILDGKNGLNQNSQFTIPATNFSPAYPVNIAPSAAPYNYNDYFSFNASNPRYISSKPVSDIPDYTTMLALDGTVPGRLSQTTAPSTPPEIPKAFQTRAAYYESDADFDALMTQPSFEIPGIGMGLLVTTDGHGDVVSESINPSSWATMFQTNQLGNLGLNRAEITIGATYKVDDPGYSFSNIQKGNGTAPAQNPSQTPSSVGALGNPNLLQNAGIFNTQPANAANALTGVDAANPVLAKLNQLQPQNPGLSLSGQDAGVDANQAQQVAVNQAGYGVNLGDNFYQNMAGVVNAANAQQQTSYAATFAPRVDQLMDGKMPGGGHGGHGGGGHARVSMNQDAEMANAVSFSVGASVADATSRNSKNGYIPFNMQKNENSTGGGDSFSSDSNPFAGNDGSDGSSGYQGGFQQNGGQGGMFSGSNRQSDQQRQTPYYYRKPLAYSA